MACGLLCLVGSGRAEAEWWLWESPHGNTETSDQTQAAVDGYRTMQGGHGVGQSFVPSRDRLERLDLMLKNRHDLRPFTITLWPWADADQNGETDDVEYAATVAGAPIWQDTGSIPGSDDLVLVTFFPQVAVTPGLPYYFEITNPTLDGEWGVSVAAGAADPYPAGRGRVNGTFRFVPASTEYVDLTFRTYSQPAGVAAPPDCAGAGPAPCSSAAGPWIDPDPPGAMPTAQDLVDLIQAKADAERPAVLGTAWGRAFEQTLYDAFLYRVTGDETYAQYVVSEFNQATLARLADLDESVPFTWLEHPGWAYLWVQDSPMLTAADHEMIRRLLLHSAMRLWDGRELGVWNHSLGRAVGFKLVTDLIGPAEFASLSACEPGPAPACNGLFHEGEQLNGADRAAWRDYADEVWGEFTARWDLLEDSSRYHYLDFKFLLELVLLYGQEDAVWSDPGFGALVRRLGEYVLPLGSLPVFGDVRGWNMSWATPFWLFTRAAARWQDPRFQWLAYRMWDYRRSHLRDELQDGSAIEFWDALYEEYPAICQAYFALDGQLPAVPPSAQGESLQARQDGVEDVAWVADSAGVGQTFLAGATPLVRLDVKVTGAGPAEAPLLLRLWPWLGDHATTVAAPPLYAADVPVSQGSGLAVAYPFVDVAPGAPYYVQLSRDDPLNVLGSAKKGPDAYADGTLWNGGVAQTGADLWFRTWSLSHDGSVVTTRLATIPRRVSQYGDPARPFDFGTAQVPDKLVLRSGYDPSDLHAVVNLVTGPYSHGQLEDAALVSLADGGSVLLVDTTYEDRREKDHDKLMTRRYRGGAHRAAPAPLAVSRFADYRGASVAWLDWDDPQGWGARHQRRFYFVKNRFLLVRDRTTFTGAMEATTGTVWHAYDVHPEHGPNWYSLFDRTPLGLGGWSFKNPERYVLLYAVERAGHEVREWQVPQAGNPPSGSFVVDQRWAGAASAGDVQWFDTLLLPYGGERSPGEVADDVEVVVDDGAALALKVSIGDERWTVVDNPDEVVIASVGLLTDARYLVARTDGAGRGYLLADRVGAVDVDDGPGRRILLDWPARASTEIPDTSRFQDLDGDGIVDADDDDDDGDGVADVDDIDPTNRFACGDVDGDACDDCSFGSFDPDHDGTDLDGDGRCGLADNCPLLANPGQADGDGDGVGDACDNCPGLSNAAQTDSDSDSIGNVCDNCPLLRNVSQADRDADGIGDACDDDDGLIVVRLGGSDRVEWQKEAGFTSWNCYRGDLAALRAHGTYTQAPGSNGLAARWCGEPNAWLVEADPLPAGAVAFYLVSGVSAGQEGDLGQDGAGAPRPNDNPCP